MCCLVLAEITQLQNKVSGILVWKKDSDTLSFE